MRKHEIQHQPQKKAKDNSTSIARLLNSIFYFLDCVFIIFSGSDYRLVILHHDHVLMHSHYKTLRGAKIAFAKFFSEKAWSEEVQPQWSHLYQPDQDWLVEKLEVIKKSGNRKVRS